MLCCLAAALWDPLSPRKAAGRGAQPWPVPPASRGEVTSLSHSEQNWMAAWGSCGPELSPKAPLEGSFLTPGILRLGEWIRLELGQKGKRFIWALSPEGYLVISKILFLLLIGQASCCLCILLIIT